MYCGVDARSTTIGEHERYSKEMLVHREAGELVALQYRALLGGNCSCGVICPNYEMQKLFNFLVPTRLAGQYPIEHGFNQANPKVARHPCKVVRLQSQHQASSGMLGLLIRTGIPP